MYSCQAHALGQSQLHLEMSQGLVVSLRLEAPDYADPIYPQHETHEPTGVMCQSLLSFVLDILSDHPWRVHTKQTHDAMF